MDFLKQMYDLSKERATTLPPCGMKPDIDLRGFRKALKDMAVIAEVKYATPTEGALGITLKPSELAREFEALGAAAVSCLTEPRYFQGSPDFIPEIRDACSLPVLMKDFIVDERQIYMGRSLGADAFLLITEMLSFEELERLFRYGKGLGMDILVEVHGMDGLEKAVRIGADIIGVNVRDLATLKVVAERHEAMISHLPAGAVKVAESGINSSERLKELKGLGYDAALIGRAMVTKDSREGLFRCG